jgi:hypothetical protein
MFCRVCGWWWYVVVTFACRNAIIVVIGIIILWHRREVRYSALLLHMLPTTVPETRVCLVPPCVLRVEG